MRKLTRNFLVKCFLAGILVLGISVCVFSCMGQLPFEPGEIPVNITGEISTTDITSAVLMLTNRSKTVDVTNFTITQPEWQPPAGNQNAHAPSISISNKPKRLEKKAQYVSPSDKDYQVVVSYNYDALPEKNLAAGSGTQTILIPLPLPRQIVEVFIFRDNKGDVIISKEINNSDPIDLGTPTPENSLGEGSSPAIIPPEYRNRMATFVTIDMTKSQSIDNVSFHMGKSDYKIGKIGINDKQSIALGQGTWETTLKYTLSGAEKTLGPVNSIIVPSNDPQAIKEHYLYFYLNNRGDYAISQTWPPFPNDVSEEDLLPVDNGYGRGLVKIINNSNATAEMVSVHNLREPAKFPMTIDYSQFIPSVPVQYNKIGYVNIVGTQAFPIDAHSDYLIQVTMETNEGIANIERKAYIKDQVVTITIASSDLNINNAQGAKFTLVNNTSEWPVDIIGMIVRNKVNAWQSSYYGIDTWTPTGAIANTTGKKSAEQYVMSTTAMPISQKAEFTALITINGGGVSTTVQKNINPAILYSTAPPDGNLRTITIEDTDVPQSIKDGIINTRGARFILYNNITSWPVQIIGMTVQNKTKASENTSYGIITWNPLGAIDRGNNAVQMVMSSANMPIRPSDEFKAVITLINNGVTKTINKAISPEKLYSTVDPTLNNRTIVIDNGDVPSELQITPPTPPIPGTIGAKVKLENRVDAKWPVQITAMTVRNKARNSEKADYSSNTWTPNGLIENGKDAEQLVTDTSTMPITATDQFEARISLYGNGNSATITKDFSPSANLYSTTPATNLRTITINGSDIPTALQTPEPPPPPDPKLPDIGGANNGDTIVIDGIEWIKVRTDSTNSKLVLLMLKGVTGECVPYDEPFMCREYGASNPPPIKSYVDTWYAALNSPTLKKIAWEVNLGYPSWPGNKLAGETKYTTVAFLPCYEDINRINMGCNYRYWLTNLNCGPSIIKANGEYVHGGWPQNSLMIYVRPCIWVTTKL